MSDSTSHPGSRPSIPLFLLLAHGLLGLALLGLTAYALRHFPVGRVALAAALLAYASALWWQPRIWMLVVPAVLPVLDLAPWSGWFFYDESDLILAVTVAVSYVRMTGTPTLQRLTPAFGLLLGLVALSYGVSAYLGLVPLPAIDANALANYYSHFNSLRILKGFLWALLLLPLLRRGAGDLTRLDPYFIAGMASGLAGVTLVALWERWVFPGLLDFASDYRITATFSAMHTGGAALDGYLATALPFTALLIFRTRNALLNALGILLFASGLYALMVTFSRGLYLALVFIAIMMSIPHLAAGASAARRRGWVVLACALLLAAISWSLWKVFSTGGYRTLAALLCLFGAAFFVGVSTSVRRMQSVSLIAFAPMLGAGVLLTQTLEKGAYLSFGAAVALFLTALPLSFSARENLRDAGSALTAVLFAGMAAGVLLIARHWGGAAALQDAVWPVLLALAMVIVNRNMPAPLWQRNRAGFAVFILIGGLLGVSIPIVGNPYMQERFNRVQGDLSGRESHWLGVYSMIEPDWQSRLFGMGLGRMPENYFWKNPQHEFPGTYKYLTEQDNTFLRLGGPQYALGYGETIRMGQRITLVPHQKYVIEFDVRTSFAEAGVQSEFCEKLLLYPLDCVGAGVHVVDTKGGWRKVSLKVDSGRLDDAPWYNRRPVQFSLSTSTPKAFVDIDNVSVTDSFGRNLLENGDFTAANAHWFFTSDRHHLPWHAKNLWLHVLFEQGWVGLILFSMLTVFALARATAAAFRGEIVAAVLSSSLGGFLVVGLFDSLLDVPRSTFMFFLLLMLCGLVSSERKRRRRKRSGHSAAMAVQSGAVTV